MFESMKDDDKAVVVVVHKDGESGIGREGIERFNKLVRDPKCNPHYLSWQP